VFTLLAPVGAAFAFRSRIKGVVPIGLLLLLDPLPYYLTFACARYKHPR
jgi:hypothetical protein